MKSSFYHLQINVDIKNKPWYDKLMNTLNWDEIHSDEKMVGYADKNGTSVWFIDSEDKTRQNYDAIGTNHISIQVEKQDNVDEVESIVKELSTEMLFGTPKHRPEFSKDETETYYQIMFESPDGILFEVVYVGTKA